jgi:tRNA U34 5-methylaminomethyl-2-thiouridine-forming methyltransferase MnmC
MNRKVITTKDGSSSIFWEELNETYHSIHGAWQESKHVFIAQGTDWFIKKYPEKQVVKIFEVGLGTGLNAILTLQYALQNPQYLFEYHSIEPFPLSLAEISALNYKTLIDNELVDFFTSLHTSTWNVGNLFTNNFRFIKYQTQLLSLQIAENKFDVIYYDAFAPTKQEEMWNLESLKLVTDLLGEGGIFVTYCAKGYVKRNLKALGLEVTSPPGAAGKREMIRAIK